MGGRRRPWLAVVLALAVAGLGHAYLRRWARAVAWFTVIVASGLLLVGLFADPDTAVGELPPTVLAPILVLFLISAVDAYRIAARSASREAAPDRAHPAQTAGRNDRAPATSSTPRGDPASPAVETDEPFTCPHCGKETDPDLDFCQWCTERFDRRSNAE